MLTSQVNGTPPKPGYAAAVKRAAPGVVNIYSSKLVQHPMCELPRFRDWCERFPGLVVLSITPYGHQGPYANRPASDLTIQAESGGVLAAPSGVARDARAVHQREGRAHQDQEPHARRTAAARRDVVRAAFAWNLNVEIARMGASATLVAPQDAQLEAIWPEAGPGPVGSEVILAEAHDLATENVQLAPKARIDGNVYYHLIEMEMGAEVNGSLVHAEVQDVAPLKLTHVDAEAVDVTDDAQDVSAMSRAEPDASTS